MNLPQCSSGGAVPLERILARAFLERIDAIDERMGSGKCDSRSSGDEVRGLCKHANVSAFIRCAKKVS